MGLKYVVSYAKRSNKKIREISNREKASFIMLWIDSIWAFLRYGCTIRQYSDGQFYRYSSFERCQILTTRKYFKLVKKTNDVNFIQYLEDKQNFNKKFAKYVHRKWLTTVTMNEADFTTICTTDKGIIVKPLNGMEGNGIYIISKSELNSQEKIHTQYLKLKCENAIIEEIICQHPQMVFGNHSVNTIRAITIMDKVTHQIKFLKAVLRAGVGDTIVDNYHQGGCCYEIDVPSGKICSKGISAIGGKDLLFHPGTSTCMLGYQIPNWNNVVEGCIEAHKMLPQCRYISWDVAVTEDGIELVEGNHNGDYDMIEFVGSNKYWSILKQYL